VLPPGCACRGESVPVICAENSSVPGRDTASVVSKVCLPTPAIAVLLYRSSARLPPKVLAVNGGAWRWGCEEEHPTSTTQQDQHTDSSTPWRGGVSLFRGGSSIVSVVCRRDATRCLHACAAHGCDRCRGRRRRRHDPWLLIACIINSQAAVHCDTCMMVRESCRPLATIHCRPRETALRERTITTLWYLFWLFHTLFGNKSKPLLNFHF
jgi:hypothetical protein